MYSTVQMLYKYFVFTVIPHVLSNFSAGDTTELRGYIRINETWNDSLSDTQGATYKQYSEEVTQAVKLMF